MSRRSLRQVPRISYCEPEEPSLDEYIYCEKCGDDVYEYCSIHGALVVILDDKIPAVSPFPPLVPRAALSVPRLFLHLNYSTIPGAGLGVFSTMTLPSGVRFGPYRGKRTKDLASDYCWQIYDRNRKPSHLVDAADGDKSNWMRYVNCARHWQEQNLLAFQYQGELYYRTIKIIPRYTELMVFYGSEYANKLQIDLKKYNSPRTYAQKCGASQPKKIKMTIENTKPEHKQGFLKPINKQTNKSVVKEDSAIITTEAPSNVKTFEETPILLNGKPKNRKAEELKLQTKILQNSKEENRIGFHLKSTEKKKRRATKKVTQNNTETDKKGLIGNIVLKLTPEDNVNTGNDIPVDNKRINNKNTKEKDFTLPNNNNICQTPAKQNNIQKNIQDVYSYCDVCNYRSIHKNGLDNHMRLHDASRKFVCQTCSYRFKTTLLLKQHLIKHKQHTSYTCDICNYRCTHAGNLKSHLRTHTGEKPYACDICNFRCARADTLKSHLRTHTGEKPYACDICNYRCTHAGNLKSHLRTHTREKPYACDICNYRCTQACHLKSHLLKIHLNKP